MKKMFCIIFSILSLTLSVAQNKLSLDETVFNESKRIRVRDSLVFTNYLIRLELATKRDSIHRICDLIANSTKHHQWIKSNSYIIVNKLVDKYKSDPYYDNILSLSILPDSIKYYIINRKDQYYIAKARLGDSLSITRSFAEFKKRRDAKDSSVEDTINYIGNSYDHDWFSYEIGLQLEINNSDILKMVFKDMESDRIIVQPNKRDMNIYYTLPYAFVIALRNRFYYEPIFNQDYMLQYFISDDATHTNPNIEKYYNQVEAFIWKQYKIKVKIKTPYLVAGWKDYGYF